MPDTPANPEPHPTNGATDPWSGDVLLTEDGTPKITDFGLAKKVGESGQTQSGAVLGTPSYMAPEQAAGSKDLTPSVDVYGLGAVFYACLTGRPPFHAAQPLDTVLQMGMAVAVDGYIYPSLACLAALAFFATAGHFWGLFYAFGAAFLGLALAMTVDLRWAPFEFGVLWAVVLVTVGLHLRRLGAAAARR